MMTSTTLTKRARIRRSEEAWRELVVCFEQSDYTREQFCVDQGLALSTFSWTVNRKIRWTRTAPVYLLFLPRLPAENRPKMPQNHT